MTPPPPPAPPASPRARIKTTPARLVTKAKALFRRASTSVANSLDTSRRSRRASATDLHDNDDDVSTVRATPASVTATLPRRRRSISADPTGVDRNAAPHAVGATLWPATSPVVREASVIASAAEEENSGSDGDQAEGGLINRLIAADATGGTAGQDAARDPDPRQPADDVSPAPADVPDLTTPPPAVALDTTPRPLPDTLAGTIPSTRAASLDSSSSASPAASTTALRTSPPASLRTETTIRPGILCTSPSVTSTALRPFSSPTPSPSPTHDDETDFPSFTYISADDSVLFADDAHTTGSAVDSPLLAPIPPPPASDLSLTDFIPTPPRASSLYLHPHVERAFPTLPRAASAAPTRVPFPTAYASTSSTSSPISTTVPVAVCDPISPPRNPQLITVPAAPVPSTVELRAPTPNPLDDQDDDAPLRWATHLPPLPSSPTATAGDVAHAAIELGPPASPVSPASISIAAAPPADDDRVDVLTAYYESKLADVARQYLAEVEGVRRAKVDADRRAMAAEAELSQRAWREQALKASVDRLEAEVAALRSPSGSVLEAEGSASGEADAGPGASTRTASPEPVDAGGAGCGEVRDEEDASDSALTTAVSSPALGPVASSPKSALATPSKPKKPKKVSFSVKALIDQLERTSAQLDAAERAIAALADDNARLARFVAGGSMTEGPAWSAQEWRVVTEAMLDMEALVARVERGVAEIAELEETQMQVGRVKGLVERAVDEYVQVLEGAAALANWLHAVHAVPTADLATWDRDLQAAARIAPAIAHQLASSLSPLSVPTKSPTPPDSPENAHAHPADVGPMDHVLDWLAHAAAWARLTARHAAWMVRMAAPGVMPVVQSAGDAVDVAGWRVGGEWRVVETGVPARGASAGSVF
ncbi:hypothetical protein GGF31_007292 [Allomyces arbusculus]|nr:hypothetical protein GGF31_007292 [Allomyces arbusculus]